MVNQGSHNKYTIMCKKTRLKDITMLSISHACLLFSLGSIDVLVDGTRAVFWFIENGGVELRCHFVGCVVIRKGESFVGCVVISKGESYDLLNNARN